MLNDNCFWCNFNRYLEEYWAEYKVVRWWLGGPWEQWQFKGNLFNIYWIPFDSQSSSYPPNGVQLLMREHYGESYRIYPKT